MLNIGCIIEEKYEVIKVLGSGGMGTVYLCKNIRLGNLWAIKEIKKDDNINIDILSEPNILKELNHSGIPRIVDIFYIDDNLYMVQDFIDGQTLKDYIEEKGPLDTQSTCKIISSICDIIEYLHSINPPIIHRDLKPANIILTPNGNVVLIDFGISKVYKTNKNKDTVAMGSNGYAAPEQCGLGKSCKQTDIYGIGMVMYFLVTGKTPSTALEPFFGENYDNNVTDDLKNIIQKCVRNDIQDRYPSIEELKSQIIKCFNKTEFQQTMILEETIISNKPSIKHDIKSKNNKLRIAVLGFLLLISLILTMLYLFYSNEDVDTSKKPTMDNTMNDIPSLDNDVNSIPVEENLQPAEKTIEQPTKQATEQPVNNNITNQNTDDDKSKDTDDSKEASKKQNKGNNKRKKEKDD